MTENETMPAEQDRCEHCHNIRGVWQHAGFTGAKRSEVYLNECPECYACWPSAGRPR